MYHSAVWVSMPGWGLSFRCHLFGELQGGPRPGLRHCGEVEGGRAWPERGLATGHPAEQMSSVCRALSTVDLCFQFSQEGQQPVFWSLQACCRTRVWRPAWTRVALQL